MTSPTKVTPDMTTFGEASDAAIAALLATDGNDSEGFLKLGDTPLTFAGNAGLGVVVNGTEDGLIFSALAGGGPATFIGLSDVPASFGGAFQVLEINATNDGLQWTDPPPAPKCLFTELDDTPATLVGSQGLVVMVDPDGDEALVFRQLPAPGSSTFVGLQETPETLGNPGEFLTVSTDGITLEWAVPSGTGGGGPSDPLYTFFSLPDTPSVSQPGAFLRGAASGAQELEWFVPSFVTTFEGLTNTPTLQEMQAAPSQSLRLNGAGNAIELYTPVSTLSLTQLTDDMPATLGAAGEILVMNAGGTALEFQAASGTVANWVDLGDTTGPIGSNGQVVTVVGGQLQCDDLPAIPTSLTEFYPEFPAAITASHAGMAVAVNGLGNGLEFVEFPTGGGGGGGPTSTTTPAPVMLAITDESTVFGTGTDIVKFRAPYDITIGSVKASLTTASSSGLITVDIKINGSSIFTTDLLTIDATETTSATATTAANITSTVISDDDEITIDINGAGTNATGLKVSIIAA